MTDGRHDTELDSLLERLRRLAVEDPQSARKELAGFVGRQPEQFRPLLERLGTARDGRLRHLVARIAPELHPKDVVLPFLVRWRSKETDEFTRRALALALRQLEDATPVPVPTPPQAGAVIALYPDHVVESYEFVASRLKHRLANGIMRAHSHVLRLSEAVEKRESESVLLTAVAELKDVFRRLGSMVEAADVEPAHFDVRRVDLLEWLRAMNGRYAAQFSHIDVRFEGDVQQKHVVDASDYLLETIFWNTWVNAHVASERECALLIQVKRRAGVVTLFFIDNGPGFPEAVRHAAFQDRVSTHGGNRGRGLLEIDDAVRRLQGAVRLVEDLGGSFRLLFEFPVARI